VFVGLDTKDAIACAEICDLFPARICKIFPRYLIKVTIFETNFEYTMCVMIFSTKFAEIRLILRIIERSVIRNVHLSSHEVFVILVLLLWNLNILHIFSKKNQTLKLMIVGQVGAELIYTYRRTDRQT